MEQTKAYCDKCAAEVPVADGRCPEGHLVASGAPPVRRPRSRPPRARRDVDMPLMELFGMVGSEEEYGSYPDPAEMAPLAPPPTPPPTAWDTLPDLSTVANDGTTDTGQLVQRLWDVTEEHELAQPIDWQPEEVSNKATSGRTFRWSVVILAVLLAAGAYALFTLLTRIPEDMAAERAAQYQAATDSLQEAVGPARAAAAVIADPTTPLTDLTTSTPALAILESRAFDVLALTSRPLPEPPPLADTSAIEALIPARDAMADAASQARSIAERAALGQNVRALAARLFQMPVLPISATEEEVADIGVDLAVMLADSADALAQFPPDAFYDGFRRDAEEFAAQLDEMQVEYLDALRREDIDQAALLRGDMLRLVEEQADDLAPSLAVLGEWADEQFTQLEVTLGNVEVLLGS